MIPFIIKGMYGRGLKLLAVIGSLFLMGACASQSGSTRDLYSPSPTDPTLSTKQRRAAGVSPRFVPSKWQLQQEVGALPVASRSTEPEVVQKPEERPRQQVDLAEYDDVVYTQNGKVYQVKIMRDDANQLVVRVPDGNFSIPKNMITKIEKVGDSAPTEIKPLEETSTQ